MKTRNEIFTEAHKLARIYFNDEISLSYRQSLSKALKVLWSNNIMLKKAKSVLTKEQIKLIFSNLKCKYNAYSIYLEDKHQESFDNIKQFSYKSWPTDKGYTFFFSDEFLNVIQ